MKRILCILMSLAMVALMAGCGNQGNNGQNANDGNAGDGDGEESYNIAYITPSMDIPFWRYMSVGIERKAEELGIKVTTYDSKSSADIQYSNAQDVIAKQVDGIVISPTDSASCVAVLSLAEEAGIPVAISDIGTDSGEYVSFVKTDNFNGSKEGGEFLASLLSEGDQVAEIVGPQARQNQQQRKAGFEEGIASAGVEIVGFQQLELENRTEGEAFMQDFLAAYPDLKAVFVTSDEATLGALAAVEAAGRDVIILGFDSNEELVAAIEDGSVAGACSQQPLLMGATALEQLVNHLNGEEVTKEIEMGTLLVTTENLAETYDTLAATALVLD